MNVKNKFTIDNTLKISLLCFSCIAIIPLIKSMSFRNEQLNKKQAHLAVRAIGDVLLTNAHDLSSPVQPIQEIDEHTLRLSFKKTIAVNPDSLSMLALKFITSEITPRAIINVFDSQSGKMVYGFEINHVAPKEIPCLGRVLPKSGYHIDISFYDHQPIQLGFNAFTVGMIGLAVASLALLSLSFFKGSPKPLDHSTIQVKGISFDLNTNQILTPDQRIKLTNKEAEVFSILFQNEGKLVSRTHLTQEVWLKQGVVTGRSLDMYISRLRKKIKGLSNTEIVNEHGKGYTLNVR